MTTMPDCPDCGRELSLSSIGEASCYRCNIVVPVVRCEDCNEWTTEGRAAFVGEDPPSAWCPDCQPVEVGP
jgi:hypothetical protein